MVGMETEVLYYGHDLARYVTGSRPNPYTRVDQVTLQHQQGEEDDEGEGEKGKEKTTTDT
jgi:hypothetical protein